MEQIKFGIFVALAIAFGLVLVRRAMKGSGVETRNPLDRNSSVRTVSVFRVKGDVATVLAEVPQVRELIEQKRLIDAIKVTRDATGLGLRESKELVEAIEASIKNG